METRRSRADSSLANSRRNSLNLKLQHIMRFAICAAMVALFIAGAGLLLALAEPGKEAKLVGTRGAAPGKSELGIQSFSPFTLQQKVLAEDGAAYDAFGHPVALSGDTMAVGAHYYDNVLNAEIGSVYVFTRSGGAWTQQQKLIASDPAASGTFGRALALNGDTLMVGAYSDNAGIFQQGSVYVFTRSNGVWTQQQKLTASDAAAFDNFGEALVMST